MDGAEWRCVFGSPPFTWSPTHPLHRVCGCNMKKKKKPISLITRTWMDGIEWRPLFVSPSFTDSLIRSFPFSSHWLPLSVSLPPFMVCGCVMKNKLSPVMTSRVWWSVMSRKPQKIRGKKPRWMGLPSLALRTDNGGVWRRAWPVSAVFKYLYMFNEIASCMIARRSARSHRVPFHKFRK